MFSEPERAPNTRITQYNYRDLSMYVRMHVAIRCARAYHAHIISYRTNRESLL